MSPRMRGFIDEILRAFHPSLPCPRACGDLSLNLLQAYKNSLIPAYAGVYRRTKFAWIYRICPHKMRSGPPSPRMRGFVGISPCYKPPTSPRTCGGLSVITPRPTIASSRPMRVFIIYPHQIRSGPPSPRMRGFITDWTFGNRAIAPRMRGFIEPAFVRNDSPSPHLRGFIGHVGR